MELSSRKTRLIGPSNEDTICPICEDILEDPVSCWVCEYHFCRKCISKWLVTSNDKCMNRCLYKEKNAHPIIYRLMDKLIFRCINSSRGCTEKLSVDNMKKHEKICQFRMESCLGCNEQYDIRELTQHKLTCLFAETPCVKCKQILIRKNIANHDDEKCFKSYVKNALAEKNQQIKLLQKEIDDLQIQIEEKKQSKSFIVIDKPFGDKYEVEQSALQAWYDSFSHKGKSSKDTPNPKEIYPSLHSSEKGYYIWMGENTWYYGTNTWSAMSTFSQQKGKFSASVAAIARGLK